MSYAAVSGHRSMALDRVRNQAYAAALRDVVGPDSVVLDLGAGTGIHGIVAARLGARRVYLVEPEDVLSVAAEIAAANHLQSTVECVLGRFEDVRLPEPVDVIVSVLTGNFLLSEDLLSVLFRARDTVLKPGGVLIPSAATMEAVPVSAEALHQKHIDDWSVPQQGVDMHPARVYAANTVFFESEGLRQAMCLAEPRVLRTFDLSREMEGPVHVESEFDITRAGVCHGWAGWCSMKLGSRWLSTSPFAEPVHWSSAFLPLDPPMVFETGERVSLAVDRAPYGDWTWTTRSGVRHQQHSTFLSTPMTAATVARAAVDYAPALGAEGLAAREVLSAFDGIASVAVIAESLQQRYPARFPHHSDALRFVQRLVRHYA